MDKKSFNLVSILFSLMLVLTLCGCSIPEIQVEVEPAYKLEYITDVSRTISIARDPLTDVLYFFRPYGGCQVMLNADGTSVTYDQYIAVYGEPDES